MRVLRKATESTKSVGGSSIELLPANPRRAWARISNASSVGIWLSFGGTATIGTGVYIPPSGGGYEIDEHNLWQGQVNGIAASGSGNVVGVLEFQ